LGKGAADAYKVTTLREKWLGYSDEQIKELITTDFIERINILAPRILARKGHYGELFQQITNKAS
jgi:excinuclease ABC subunit A